MNEQQVEHDAISPEVLALREARRQAFEVRVAAEQALRDAEQAEAALIAEEECALAAAAAARRDQLAEAARVAAARERDAIERVSTIQAQLSQFTQARKDAQMAAAAVAQALAEAKSALERLIASGSEREREVETAAEQVRKIELELIAARQRAHDATQARAQADAALALTEGSSEALRSPNLAEAEAPRLAVVSDFATIAAQRAAERRAADAARTRV